MKKTLPFMVIVLAFATLILCLALPAKAYTEGGYTYIVTNGEAKITTVDISTSGDIIIPSTLGDYPVTSIGSFAFENCTELTGITIPDGITIIDIYAFYKCSGLSRVEIGNSVTNIGAGAFFKCTGLKNVIIGNKVKNIGSSAFSDCTSLTTVYGGDSVISIGDNAFDNCTKLTNINIGSCVEVIGRSAFSDCIQLTNIEIGDSATNIGDFAFWNCTSLNYIEIGENIVNIGDNAFFNTGYYNDDNNWEDCVLYIGKYLIRAKDMLINGNAEYVRECTIKEDTKLIAPGAFDMCTRLTSVKIPSSVLSVGDEAFRDCIALTSIVLPESVKKIGEKAFQGCESLINISIPFSVENIGNYAFYDCSDLQVVYYNGTKKDWEKITIGSNNTPLLSVELITKNNPIEDAISRTTLSMGVVMGETVIIVPTNKNAVAMKASELSDILNDSSITITSNNGVIGTGSKLTIGEYEVSLVVKGDIDGDGIATVFDGIMIKKAIANNGFENEGLREFAGDVDGVAGTTDEDVKAILSHIVGKDYIE